MQLVLTDTALTAVNGAPSGVVGKELRRTHPSQPGFSEREVCDDKLDVVVWSTAGSGTMTVTGALWGFHPGLNIWVRLGLLNGGTAIGETSADSIAYSERVVGLAPYTRIYAEVTAIAGTATAVKFALVAR